MLAIWIISFFPLILADVFTKDGPYSLSRCGLNSSQPWSNSRNEVYFKYQHFTRNPTRNFTLADDIAKGAAKVVAEVAQHRAEVAQALNTTNWIRFYRRFEMQFKEFSCDQLTSTFSQIALDVLGYTYNVIPARFDNWEDTTLWYSVKNNFTQFVFYVIDQGQQIEHTLSQLNSTNHETVKLDVNQQLTPLLSHATQLKQNLERGLGQILMDIAKRPYKTSLDNQVLAKFYLQIIEWFVPFLQHFQFEVNYNI